jgi:hypothetical protein
VCLYLPGGRIACQFERPHIHDNTRFDAGGLSFDVASPMREATMTYEGDVLLLDDPDLLRTPEKLSREARRVPAFVRMEQRAVSPAHGGVPASTDQETMYGRDFSFGHFNQHTRVSGLIRVGDEEWPLDGHGWRDHSWGPRLWQNIYFYRLFIANFGDDRAFMLLKITDAKGRPRRTGVLLVDGAYEEITDMDIITDWSATMDPLKVRLSVRTSRRSAIIAGDVLTLAPLRNRRDIDGELVTSRIAEAFTKFTWDGDQGYGICEYIERMEGGRLVGYPL